MLDDEREIMLYKIVSFLRRHAKQILIHCFMPTKTS